MMQFSFSSISSMVGKIVQRSGTNIKMSHAERVEINSLCMRHLNIRTASLNNLPDHAGNRRKAELHHMYGKNLEQFVFPNGKADFADYSPPDTRGQEITKRL
jgi:hypothetical protein